MNRTRNSDITALQRYHSSSTLLQRFNAITALQTYGVELAGACGWRREVCVGVVGLALGVRAVDHADEALKAGTCMVCG